MCKTKKGAMRLAIFELSTIAKIDNWPQVYKFLVKSLKQTNISYSNISRILLSCEEIFVNISRYAYNGKEGSVKIVLNINANKNILTVKFTDSGKQFDPTKIPQPKISGPAELRKIGGLGIYIVSKLMDNMIYNFTQGQNNLIISKKLTD